MNDPPRLVGDRLKGLSIIMNTLKTILVMGMVAGSLFFLCACTESSTKEPVEERPLVAETPERIEEMQTQPPDPEIWEGDKEGFAELYGMTDWAWAITDWESETPTDTMVAVEYSSPDVLDSLTIAAGSENRFLVTFAGEKDGIDEFGWPFYYPRYKTIIGPTWKTEGRVLPTGVCEEYILLPPACEAGILPITRTRLAMGDRDGFYDYGHPPADSQDIAIIESQRNGRQYSNIQEVGICRLFK